MPERQAGDKRRAEAKAAQREKRYPEHTFKKKPRWNNVETDEWGPREVSGEWERCNYTNGNYQTEEMGRKGDRKIGLGKSEQQGTLNRSGENTTRRDQEE